MIPIRILITKVDFIVLDIKDLFDTDRSLIFLSIIIAGYKFELFFIPWVGFWWGGVEGRGYLRLTFLRRVDVSFPGNLLSH